MTSQDTILFEWDEKKNQENIRKHGIDFHDIEGIFDDELRIELYDASHSTKEEVRYIVIGFVQQVLYVVYTERGEAIRLISARIATESERKLYYDCSRILQEEH